VALGLLLFSPAAPLPPAAAQSTTAATRGVLAGRSVGAALAAPVAPRLGQLGHHQVQAGESLPAIALRYHVRPVDLAWLNARSPRAILLPGSDLWVPLAATAWAPPAATPAPPPKVIQAVVPPSAEGPPTEASPAADADAWESGEAVVYDATQLIHVVEPGDTLTSIAGRYGTTADLLRQANGLESELIQPGQPLSVPRAGAGPAAADPAGQKRIEIAVSEQRMYVWQGDTLVWSWLVSTGVASHPTRRGTFAVESKIDDAWSSAWQLSMPDWLGIYWAGGTENGIHALPTYNGQRLWADALGTPMSYGCVVLGVEEAALLYDWALVGTPVEIRD
jgi:LysM repeat protein